MRAGLSVSLASEGCLVLVDELDNLASPNCGEREAQL
jgi:hypothetical protein